MWAAVRLSSAAATLTLSEIEEMYQHTYVL